MAMGGPRVPGGCEAPAAANQGKMGCYLDVAVEIGPLPGQVYWHIDEFPNEASARGAATRASAVVSAYGRTFLETVNADAAWRPRGGTRLAVVGPMPVPEGVPLTARFMQGMTEAGATTRPHRHSGPEGFLLLDGAICVETPAGAHRTNRWETLWLPGEMPMHLTSAAGGVRRSVLVVIHPSSQPWMTVMPEWTPTGACTLGG